MYYNYTSSGLSLQYTPAPTYQPARTAAKRSDLDETLLCLSTIDVYTKSFDFLVSPVVLTYLAPPDPGHSAADIDTLYPATIELTASISGQKLVSSLGEPDRKGGGESRAVGVWLEWTGLGLMAEFCMHGANRWDKDNGAGSTAVAVYSFFEPGKEVGGDEE